MTEHPNFEQRLHFSTTQAEAGELYANTLEPRDWPAWLDGLMKRTEQFSHAKTGNPLR